MLTISQNTGYVDKGHINFFVVIKLMTKTK